MLRDSFPWSDSIKIHVVLRLGVAIEGPYTIKAYPSHSAMASCVTAAEGMLRLNTK